MERLAVLLRVAATLAALVAPSGCAGGAAPAGATASAPSSGAARVRVLVTISTFLSFARAVGGDRVVADSLVPAGASPEDYSPAPADIAKVHDADLLFENGLGLETWLARTIDNAKNAHLKIVTATDGLPAKRGNPHLWMDPVLAKRYAGAMRDALSAIDPAGSEQYARNTAVFERRLDLLQCRIARRLDSIPASARNMIVFHNAWQYYDDRFGLRTLGVLELSPGQEPNPQYVNNLVTLARANHVRAVFAEPEYSPKLVQTLASSSGIKTVEDLYDDSVATAGPVKDYESMLLFDTEVITGALGGNTGAIVTQNAAGRAPCTNLG
jgi:ABC-type Zn uptake system ZnuABC Zn-binding protein ZnuA